MGSRSSFRGRCEVSKLSEIYNVKIFQRGQVVFATRITTADSTPEAVLDAMNSAAELGVGDEPGETTTIEVVRRYHGLGEKE